jgi:prepilin-type N-terminal cleavage/methylation domain-containing protein
MNRSRHSHSEKTAFTLIELLVVIAIISLLVSILLPSLNRAKKLARRAMCLANMKIFGLVTPLYANDYNGSAPPHRQQGPGIPLSEMQYFRILHSQEFMEEDGAFVCPENGTPKPGSSNATTVQWYIPRVPMPTIIFWGFTREGIPPTRNCLAIGTGRIGFGRPPRHTS